MKKNKCLVKDKEKIILQYIDDQSGAVSANEVSKATGISYVTARKYLDKLVKEGLILVEHGKKKHV